jgi:hypothetical protein
MNDDDKILEEDVRQLARLADLPLEEGRHALIAGLLDSWLPDAKALSRKMAAEEFREVAPITVFAHRSEDRGSHAE